MMILIFVMSSDSLSGEKSGFITTTIWKFITFITSYEPTLVDRLSTSFLLRKIAHISEYFLLFITYYYGFFKSKIVKVQNVSYIALIFTLFYAMTDELHQAFIPNRVGTYEDVLIDSIGALVSFLLLKKVL